MRCPRWLPHAGFALLSLWLAGTIWVVPYLPTNDGPEWVFASHVQNHYSDPDTPYRDIFTPALQFAGGGFTVLFSPLEAWFGWQRGLQLALTVTALLVAWGFVALVRELAPERWALGFLGFPLALSWEFYMGFWAFVVSTGIGLFVLALAVRLQEPTWKGRALVSVLLLAEAVAHVFGAVLTGGALLLLCIARAPRGKRSAELGRVAVTGLPAASILLGCILVSHRMANIPFAHAFGRFPWRDAAQIFPQTIAPGPLGRAAVVTLGVAIAAVLAVFRARRTDTSRADRGLGIAAVILLLAGALTPYQIPGWQGFSERFVPLGVALVVAVLPLERLSRASRRFASPALFAAAALWVGLSYPFHRRLAGLCRDATAGLTASVPLRGTILPVMLNVTELPRYDYVHAEVPTLLPLLHMTALYAAVHGGVSTYFFALSPAIYPLEVRPPDVQRPVPDFEHYTTAVSSYDFHHDIGVRREVENELASFGVFYDEVAVFGAFPVDLALWRERGYRADWEQGTAMLAHFEPCSIDFTAPVSARDPGPVFDIRVGKIGLASSVHAASVVADDGLAHFKIAPAPCGVVAVRARWAPAPDGTSVSCRNANADGDLVEHISMGSHRIACDAR